MKIGDEILIRAKMVDQDSNPRGSAIKVEVMGFVDHSQENEPFGEIVKFWIHRLDQPNVIVEKKP